MLCLPRTVIPPALFFLFLFLFFSVFWVLSVRVEVGISPPPHTHTEGILGCGPPSVHILGHSLSQSCTDASRDELVVCSLTDMCHH